MHSSVWTVMNRSCCECSQTRLCLEELFYFSWVNTEEHICWIILSWCAHVYKILTNVFQNGGVFLHPHQWPRRAGWQHIPAPALGIVTLLNVGCCLGTGMSLGFCLHFSEDWRCWASGHVLAATQTSFMRCLHVFSCFNFIFSPTCKNSLYILDKALCLSLLQIFSVGLWFFAKQRFSFMCSSRSFRS